jgi:hypothetical protein
MGNPVGTHEAHDSEGKEWDGITNNWFDLERSTLIYYRKANSLLS